jgi:RecA-family ATPase
MGPHELRAVPAEAAHAPSVPEARPADRVLAIPWNLPSVWDLTAKIEWFIPDMLPLRGITLLSAASGTGKTWLAHAIAGAVAHGSEFLGRKAERRPVLYFDRENPLAVVKRNLDGLGIRPSRDLHLWGGWHTEPAPGPDGDPRILEFARAHGPLLIWDSLVRFHTGDEQSARDTSGFMNHFRKLADAGATLLLLHHTGKTKTSQEYRGSSDFEAAVDMAYTPTRHSEGRNAGSAYS